MWPPWGKSSPKISDKNTNTIPKHSNNNPPPHHRRRLSSSYRCSSFKDIENLCNIDFDLDNHFDNSSSSTPNHNDNNVNNINNININNININNNNNNSNNSLRREPSLPTPTRKSIFHRVRTANALLLQWASRSDPQPKPEETPPPEPTPPTAAPPPETRIVVYFTSLRVVRPTFEACRSVMSILQGFQVELDERDLTMDLSFISELRDLLGLKPTEQLTLPRVFIGGRYVGGAEEVKQLHEIGELKKLISGLPPKKPGTCNTCGGYRFILCDECSGSHKVFSEKIVEFKSCTNCNENGLIRCPDCSSPPLSRPILAPINIC